MGKGKTNETGRHLGGGKSYAVPLQTILPIFDAIDEKIYVADPETYEILYANPAKKRLFGEDIVGRKCHNAFQEMDEPCTFCTNPLIFGENLGKSHTWEFRNCKTMKWIRCIDLAIPWWDGRMVRFEMAIDIHDHKLAEEALQQSERKYRQLVEEIHEAIYATDEAGRVSYVSPVIESMTGYTPSEIMSRPFRDFVFPADFDYTKKRFAEVLSGEVKPTEFRIVKKSGETMWVRTFSKPVYREGKAAGLQGTLLDIEEQKKANASLKEREKELSVKAARLEELNAALRVLLKVREQDKKETEEKILLNIKELVMPYVEKLKKSLHDGNETTYLEILESNLHSITSPFSRDLHFKYLNLTLVEMQIAGLIRDGKTSKEIADLMNLSSRTIESHRKHIRKKMGLRNVKGNLRSTLMTYE